MPSPLTWRRWSQVLNEFMRNMWQIDWVGQFQDLCSGDGEFPAKIRESFTEDGEPIDAIPEDMIDDFREFLRSYGF